MWLKALFHRATADDEMTREMTAHLAMEQDALEERGLPPSEAHRQARVAFGGVERHKEAVRDERGTRFLLDLGGDIRYSWRGLRLRPLFAASVIGIVALGLGSTMAVFAWAYGMLFQPIPGVTAQDRLVPILFRNESGSDFGTSYSTFIAIRGFAPLLHQSIGSTATSLQIDQADGPARELSGTMVTGDYFGVLGVTAELGRVFTPAELDPVNDPRTVVISDALWRSHFGSAPDVIGRRIRLNATTFTVVGVTKRGFRGLSRSGQTDIWLPLSALPTLQHDPKNLPLDPFRNFVDKLLVRMPAGAHSADVQQAVLQAVQRLSRPEDNETYKEYPPSIDGRIGTPARMLTGETSIAERLLGVVGLILLLTCANTANMLLLRAARRAGEQAVRQALGASFVRIVRQHLVDGLMLAIPAGLFALILMFGIGHIFANIRLYGLPAFDKPAFDWRVVAVALLLTLGATLLFSVAPAFAATRQVVTAFRAGARSDTRRAQRLRSVLCAVQIAVAMTLTVGSILLASSIHNLLAVDTGLNPATTTYGINTQAQGYKGDRLHGLRTGLITLMRQQPGVQAVAVAEGTPFDGGTFGESLRPAGWTAQKWPVHSITYGVSPDYFSAVGTRVIAGRSFAPSEFDDSLAHVVVLSLAAARALFGATNPLGLSVERRGFSGVETLTVVGIVSDSRTASLREANDPVIYSPEASFHTWSITLIVRATLPPAELDRTTARVLAAVDPTLPLGPGQRIRESILRTIAPERLFGRLVGLLAVIAALLSAIGLYALIASAVTARTREFGIRTALGASSASLVRLVMRQGITLGAAGIAVGTIGAYGLSQVLRSYLFHINPTSAVAYLMAGAAALLLCLGASLLPARSATRINPVDALKSD
jgi:predicted permease